MRLMGHISYVQAQYTFMYDGDYLMLVPIEPTEFDLRKHFEKQFVDGILWGNAIDSHEVYGFFVHQLHYAHCGYLTRPAGHIILFSPNGCFDAFTFRGDVVNNFYAPHRVIDDELSVWDVETGKAEIILNPFSKTTKRENILKRKKISEYHAQREHSSRKKRATITAKMSQRHGFGSRVAAMNEYTFLLCANTV